MTNASSFHAHTQTGREAGRQRADEESWCCGVIIRLQHDVAAVEGREPRDRHGLRGRHHHHHDHPPNKTPLRQAGGQARKETTLHRPPYLLAGLAAVSVLAGGGLVAVPGVRVAGGVVVGGVSRAVRAAGPAAAPHRYDGPTCWLAGWLYSAPPDPPLPGGGHGPGVSPGSFHSCAVGFSAVLFSLKYVLNSSAPGSTPVFGFEVPTRLACWAELVLISFVTPNASFLGHLCGSSGTTPPPPPQVEASRPGA